MPVVALGSLVMAVLALPALALPALALPALDSAVPVLAVPVLAVPVLPAADVRVPVVVSGLVEVVPGMAGQAGAGPVSGRSSGSSP
jgi:hypothetical protein